MIVRHTSIQNIDLCVVIPVCNEEACIVAVIEELYTVLVAIPTLKQVALLIVDDFSQDDGITRLKQWFSQQQLRDFSLTIIRLQHQHGVGDAQLKGFKLAVTWQPRLTLVMDADGQHDPSCVSELVELSASVDIVCTLRGKRGDSLFYYFCIASFYNLMKYICKKSVSSSNFCLMKLPVLEYLANANHIDYLGAFLNVGPFSYHKLTIERRARIAGSSKLGFFGHAYTAAVIMSYHHPVLANVHKVTMLLLIVLGTIVITTASPVAITMFTLFAVLTQLWHIIMTKILSRRSIPSQLVIEDPVEQVDQLEVSVTTGIYAKN